MNLSIMLEWHKEYKEQVDNLVTDYKEFRSSADSLDKTLENVSSVTMQLLSLIKNCMI